MSFFDFLFGGSSSSFGGSIKQETVYKIQSDWTNIKVLVNQKGPSQLRQALITADKSLDNALRDVVAGETMGERLKNAKTKFDYNTYNKIWEAHKLRNNLVHESGFEPPYYMVTQAIEDLQDGLVVLGIRV